MKAGQRGYGPKDKAQTPITDRLEENFGEMPGALRRLEQEHAELTAQLSDTRRRLAEVEAINKRACADWADDDTAIKELARPFGIRDDDTPGYFKNSVQIVEELTAKLTALRNATDGLTASLGEHQMFVVMWAENWRSSPTYGNNQPEIHPTHAGIIDRAKHARAAYAALISEGNQPSSDSNSPTASREIQG